MASSSNISDASARIQDLEYLYTSNSNVSNFVSVKLSGYGNYYLWKTQMLCLMEAHEMRGLIDDGPRDLSMKIMKKYDILLKGWIFGSVSEDVLSIVVDLDSAKDVWEKLKICFDSNMSTEQVTGTFEKYGLGKQKTGVNLTGSEIKDEDMDSAEPKVQSEDYIQSGTKDSAPKTETIYEDDTRHTRVSRDLMLTRLRDYIENEEWNAVSHMLINNIQVITESINSDGNTALHIAVGIGRNDIIKRVLRNIGQVHDGDYLTRIKNSDGSTLLHIAAIVGNTNAVELLVHESELLLHVHDNKGKSPLDKAFENMHLNTIASILKATEDHESRRKSSLLPPVQIGSDLLVNAISAKQYTFALNLMTRNIEYAVSNDNVLMALARTFPSELGYWETLICPSFNNIPEMIVERTKSLFHIFVYTPSYVKRIISAIKYTKFNLKDVPILLSTCVPIAMVYFIYFLILLPLLMVYFTLFMLYFPLWKFAAKVVPPIKNIEQKKKEFEQAKSVLEVLCEKIDHYNTDKISCDSYRGPILEAACQDAYEVVDAILGMWPQAIQCKDKNGYDIIQLATIHRSKKVYNLIYIMGERKTIYGTMEDSSKNNMLHLAGRLAPSNKLKRRTGAALQLQRELQWRQEVQKVVFPTYVTKENIFMETPEMVFTKEHENLVKEGENWIKTVAEYSSITAALITTIVFAAAITVPGGNNQETGVPVFMNEFAFIVFAIADAVSLFSSATALLVFLSILTARFAEKDFLVSLPRRLIIGLCTLLISTTAMMVAFSATLFLVFSHRKLWMLAPICGLAFLPIAIFFILQVPLIVDLFRSTYISNFGKSNHKLSRFNPKNIQLFFGK